MSTEPNSNPIAVCESGSFSFAMCACRWRGPARRSRRMTREDADEHRKTGCAPSTSEMPESLAGQPRPGYWQTTSHS